MTLRHFLFVSGCTAWRVSPARDLDDESVARVNHGIVGIGLQKLQSAAEHRHGPVAISAERASCSRLCHTSREQHKRVLHGGRRDSKTPLIGTTRLPKSESMGHRCSQQGGEVDSFSHLHQPYETALLTF